MVLLPHAREDATIFGTAKGSVFIAIAAIFAIIVMHDAMGVRFETGKQAKILNEMMDIFKSMGNSTLTAEEKLKEFVGHTKLQVAMGALLGIVIAVILG